MVELTEMKTRKIYIQQHDSDCNYSIKQDKTHIHDIYNISKSSPLIVIIS